MERFAAVESWVKGTTSVVEDEVTKLLNAPDDLEGQRIVVVTGGSIRSDSSTSRAEINLHVLVPPMANLTLHGRRLFVAEVDNATYHVRVHSWLAVLENLGSTQQFETGVRNALTFAGLPIPLGMSIRSRSSRIERFDTEMSSDPPSFVFFVEPGGTAENQKADVAGGGVLAGALLPVSLVFLCLNACVVSRLRCVRHRLEKVFGMLQDQALDMGVSVLKDTPFTPSPQKRKMKESHPQLENTAIGSASSLHSQDCGDVSPFSRRRNDCEIGSGPLKGLRSLELASPTCATLALGPGVQGGGGGQCCDDLDVCSFTSSPRSEGVFPTSPEVVTPFRSRVLVKDSPARIPCDVEDLAPAPASLYAACGSVPANPRAGATGNIGPPHSLNSIFAPQPPQPPRHSAGLLEEAPQSERNRFSEWISFSPLRRVLRGKPTAPGSIISPSRSVGSSSKHSVEANHEGGQPTIVNKSPVRLRRGKPTALDIDLQEEAQADPAMRSRSDRSTPHRDTCLQVSSPFLQAELERWTPSLSQTSPFQWRQGLNGSLLESPTALCWQSGHEGMVNLDYDLPNSICTPTNRRKNFA